VTGSEWTLSLTDVHDHLWSDTTAGSLQTFDDDGAVNYTTGLLGAGSFEAWLTEPDLMNQITTPFFLREGQTEVRARLVDVDDRVGAVGAADVGVVVHEDTRVGLTPASATVMPREALVRSLG
jgi:hypothetical protein